MEKRDERLDIKGLVKTLRRVTTAVQILPFVYAVPYIFVLSAYNFTTEVVQSALDATFYISPVVVISTLFLSRVLKLCKWHKTACIIPLVPQAASAFDYYILSFSDEMTYAFTFIIVVMVILLLIAAYKVFFK